MFKKIILTIAVLFSITGSAFAADLKIGIFDERLVLGKLPQTEAIKSKLETQFKDRMEELRKLQSDGIKMQEKYKRDAVTMTEAERISLQRKLTELGTELKTKDKNLNEDTQRAQQVEINKIRLKIKKTLDKLAKEENFDLILRAESVAAGKNTLDVSNKIITILSNPAG